MSKRHPRDRGDGGLYQRADGMWVGTVELPTTDGKRRRATVSSRSYDDAVAKLRKLRRHIDDGTFAASGKTTVAQWCDRWLESIVRPRVRPNTFRYYEGAVRGQIVPAIGKIRLSKLTPEHVRQLHRAVQATSTRNAVKAHQALQKALQDAVREGLLARNVAELVDKPKHVTRSYGTLTTDEARHLINTAIDRGDPLASRWAAAFYTGARPAELLGLQWEHVDFDAGTIELAWQLQHHKKGHGCGGTCGRARPGACPQARWNLPAGFDYREAGGSLLLTRPKTKAGWRVVPIAAPLLAMLRAHYVTARAAVGGETPEGLVWTNRDGGPIHARDDRHAWVAACEASGLARRRAAPPALSVAGPDDGLLVTTQDVADLLGVSRPTIAKAITAGELPFQKRNGGRWRMIRVGDLLESELPQRLGGIDAEALLELCDRRRGAQRVTEDHDGERGHIDWEIRPPALYVSRHTMATLLQEAGVSEAVAMQITGHSSAVTHREYVHTGLAVKRGAIAALEAVYDAEVVDE